MKRTISKLQRLHAGSIRSLLVKSMPINYPLWCLVFVYMIWVHFQLRTEFEGLVDGQAFWALVIGALNALIFVLLGALVDMWLEKFAHPRLRWVWGGVLALFLIGIYVDLLLFRKTSIHLPTAARLFLGSGWDQTLMFQEILGVKTAYFFYSCLFFVALVPSGVVVRSITWSLGRRFMIRVPSYVVLIAVGLLSCVYSVWGTIDHRSELNSRTWREVNRVLPVMSLTDSPPPGQEIMVGPIKAIEAHSNDIESPAADASMGAYPNVYVIIIESMREDFLREEITPNLVRFQEDCLVFEDSIAASNASHTSWFSLFSGQYPIYYGMVYRDKRLWGSPAMKSLRKAGYEVNIFTSSFLGYHNFEKIAFGPWYECMDNDRSTHSQQEKSRPERDRQVMRSLQKMGAPGSQNTFNVAFLASSHHDYHWPKSFDPPFLPVADMWNYYLNLEISSEELEQIKNRYKNSLYFTDQLIGTFLNDLKQSDRYQDSIILITSDHGEAFLEHGKLVHASELHREQINVPFLLKLPTSSSLSKTLDLGSRTATHTDFLPTLFDLLELPAEDGFDGRSLLSEEEDFVVTVDDNGNRDPYRFCVIRGNTKYWLQYRSPSTLIALDDTVFLTRITDRSDVDLVKPHALKHASPWTGLVSSKRLGVLFPEFHPDGHH